MGFQSLLYTEAITQIMRTIIPLIFVTSCLFGGLFNAPHSYATPKAGTSVGVKAPNWLLQNTSGDAVSLYQQAEAGITVVMVFWASWCDNCKHILPRLEALNTQKGHQPFQIYLMNVWEDKSPEVLRELAPGNMPILMRADHVARRFNVGTTPGIVVVNPDKRIIYKRNSGAPIDNVMKDLQALLTNIVTDAQVSTKNRQPTNTTLTH